MDTVKATWEKEVVSMYGFRQSVCYWNLQLMIKINLAHIWFAPYCKKKFVCDKKNNASIYPALERGLKNTPSPDGICTFLPHQTFGLIWAPELIRRMRPARNIRKPWNAWPKTKLPC